MRDAGRGEPAQDLNILIVASRQGNVVRLRDVGTVEDASDIPTGYALVNGRRTVYLPVTKRTPREKSRPGSGHHRGL